VLKRRAVVQASLAGAVVAGVAGIALVAREQAAPADEAGWRPTAWPFPRDGWPPGRAWRLGTIEVYVRPKLGFCGNCDTGVVNDEEVDRVTDIDLLDERFAPAGVGSAIRVGRFAGRSRIYRYKIRNGALRHAEGIAVSQKCDLIVAVIAGNLADERERASAHRFLDSDTVQGWLERELEGR